MESGCVEALPRRCRRGAEGGIAGMSRVRIDRSINAMCTRDKTRGSKQDKKKRAWRPPKTTRYGVSARRPLVSPSITMKRVCCKCVSKITRQNAASKKSDCFSKCFDSTLVLLQPLNALCANRCRAEVTKCISMLPDGTRNQALTAGFARITLAILIFWNGKVLAFRRDPEA